MNRNTITFIMLTLVGYVCIPLSVFSQQIDSTTILPENANKSYAEYEKEYLDIINSIQDAWQENSKWHNTNVVYKYGVPYSKAIRELKAHPEREKELRPVVDSLKRNRDIYFAISEKRRDSLENARKLAFNRYFLVSGSAFKIVYQSRKSLSKQEMMMLYHKASKAVRKSEAGRAVIKYIKTEQIKEGDKFRSFYCFDSTGNRFNWHNITGKRTIIICDGLGCMTHGIGDIKRPSYYFQDLLKKYGNDKTQFIIFFHRKNLNQLKEQINIFGTEPFTCIADGGTVGSSIEIIYNVDTTPSVIYINEFGIIDKITEGVTKYIESFLANKM